MKRHIALGVCLFLVAAGSIADPIRAFEDEPDENAPEWSFSLCGDITRTSYLEQMSNNGHPISELRFYVETSFGNACPFMKKAEGVVDGWGGSSLDTGWKWGVAANSRQLVTTGMGLYFHETTHHFKSLLGYFPAGDLGDSSNTINMQSEPEDPDPLPGENGSPIIFDMDGNGFDLTGQDDAVWFDIDADGIPDKVNWTKAGSDETFLAMDRNGNGKIDNGAELFGNATPVYFSGPSYSAENGFLALRMLESPQNGATGSFDNVISESDCNFARLLLWRDINHDGISQPNELRRASDAGLKAIGTDYKQTRRRDRYGNLLRQQAGSEWVIDGKARRIRAVDVWFVFETRK